VRQAKRLRRELTEDFSLKVNAWLLKSWDLDGVGIVEVHCLECRKDYGRHSRNHKNNAIVKLFSNFKTSHLVSTQHVENWYQKHNVSFMDHPDT